MPRERAAAEIYSLHAQPHPRRGRVIPQCSTAQGANASFVPNTPLAEPYPGRRSDWQVTAAHHERGGFRARMWTHPTGFFPPEEKTALSI
ncbi:unnamed protein product, partial [Clonostachys byssicola]